MIQQHDTFHVSVKFVVVSFFFLKSSTENSKHFPKRLTQIKDDHARVSLPLIIYIYVRIYI